MIKGNSHSFTFWTMSYATNRKKEKENSEFLPAFPIKQKSCLSNQINCASNFARDVKVKNRGTMWEVSSRAQKCGML